MVWQRLKVLKSFNNYFSVLIGLFDQIKGSFVAFIVKINLEFFAL